jgi:hypothetical protein
MILRIQRATLSTRLQQRAPAVIRGLAAAPVAPRRPFLRPRRPDSKEMTSLNPEGLSFDGDARSKRRQEHNFAEPRVRHTSGDLVRLRRNPGLRARCHPGPLVSPLVG